MLTLSPDNIIIKSRRDLTFLYPDGYSKAKLSYLYLLDNIIIDTRTRAPKYN